MDFLEFFFYLVFFGLLVVCAYQYIYLNLESFQLKCIVSTVDGEKYCVRERDRLQDAADLLANVTKKCKNLVEYMEETYPNDKRVQQLVERFNPKTIIETLPTSEFTAYSENKGEKLAFCLNTEKNGNNLIDPNTLTFVAIHELAHIATKSVGHKDEFWSNFKFLLGEASKINIYNQTDYKKKPVRYCGMTITDNPYYDF